MRRKKPDPRGRHGGWVLVVLLGLALLYGGFGLDILLPPGPPNPSPMPSATQGPTEGPPPSSSPTDGPGTTATPSAGPTQAPTVEPTRPPTPTPTPKATPTPAATPTHGTVPAGLSTRLLGWYYFAPSPTGQALPAGIPAEPGAYLDTWGGLWRLPDGYAREDDAPRIALTFDEGYEYKDHTTRILATLKDRQVIATFFLSGDFLESQPDLVRKIHSDGHQAGNHTWDHPSLPTLAVSDGDAAVLQQMTKVEEAYEALCGVPLLKLMRPPMGEYSERLLAWFSVEGYVPVFWSFAYRDWLTNDQPDPEEAKARILGQLHDGSILLLHTVSATNVEILPDLIDAIRAQGYRIVPLPTP